MENIAEKIFDPFTDKDYNVTFFYGKLPRATVAINLASLYNSAIERNTLMDKNFLANRKDEISE